MNLVSAVKKIKINVAENYNSIVLKNDIYFAIYRYDHAISNAQTYPITHSLKNSVAFTKLDLFLGYLKKSKSSLKAVFIQALWDCPFSELEPILEAVKKYQKNAKVVFLDWYAPLHIPNPKLIDHVDLYVKKQALKDISQYKGMFDHVLVEYESQWNKQFLDVPHIKINVEKLEKKLFVGWNFATDKKRIRQLRNKYYINKHREIDIHCRICAPEERNTWYNHMRGRAYDAVHDLDLACKGKIKILNENILISYRKYINEMRNSKLCISPFGYGEVCWRDFEAILSGALLVKPDMSHIKTNPDIFIPYETYIPCKWDFSDLEEQCLLYLDNAGERERITQNASRVWENFLDSGWEKNFTDLLESLHLDAEEMTPL